MSDPVDVPGDGVIPVKPDEVVVTQETPTDEYGTVLEVQPAYADQEVVSTETVPPQGEVFKVSTDQ